MRLLAVALGMLVAATAGAQGLCDRIRAMVAEPAVAAAHWGVSVSRLDGAGGLTAVCGVNEGQLFRPASNNKVFTTATAMALLGAEKKFETRVTGKLDAATGVVAGDLTLVGGGDANLDSGDLPYLPAAQRPKVTAPFTFHDLVELAAQLVSAGVKRVEGDVVGDDTLFPYEPYPPSWNADDFVWSYGAPVSALTIADNQLLLLITPGVVGGAAGVALDQHGVLYYTVVNEVRTVAAKATAGIGVERLPGSRTVRVYGTIAADAGVDKEEIAIDEPAEYAAMAFKGVLAAHGIAVAGRARAVHRPVRDGVGFFAGLEAKPAPVIPGDLQPATCELPPVGEPVLAQHQSDGLLPDVNLTNKVSQNLHAELMLRQLGLVSCGQGSGLEGSRLVRAFLLHAGVRDGDFLLYDGSGLSDHDLVTPRALAAFLAYAAKQPWFTAWRGTLPEGGVDGTLNSRFPGLKGRIFAKTGTLGESRALSGYVVNAGGETMVFSVLVDTHLPGVADRGVMDRVVGAIAAER